MLIHLDCQPEFRGDVGVWHGMNVLWLQSVSHTSMILESIIREIIRIWDVIVKLGRAGTGNKKRSGLRATGSRERAMEDGLSLYIGEGEDGRKGVDAAINWFWRAGKEGLESYRFLGQ